MMKTIINLHGFATTGNNSKFKVLKRLFPNYKIISPDLEIEPFRVISQIQLLLDSIDDKNKLIMVGSSLGGFYAHHTAVRNELPYLLINPSMQASDTIKRYVGENRNLITGEKFIFKKDYINQLLELEQQIVALEKTKDFRSKVRVVLGKNDELLDINHTKRYFKDCWWREYPGNHQFDMFEQIFNEKSILEIF